MVTGDQNLSIVIVISWSYKYPIYTYKTEYEGLSAIHPSASYSNTSYVSVYYGSPGYTVV